MSEKIKDAIGAIIEWTIILTILGAIGFGIVGIVKWVIDTPNRQAEEKAMRVVDITVESTNREPAGMSCVNLGAFTSCDQDYKYTINDFDASRSAYESVEVGKTYKCYRAAIGSNRIIECEGEK